MPKKLIITADDYGASQNICEGIRYAAEKRVLTAISVMTNFRESISGIKEISEKFPEIGIGVHLNIVCGKPLQEIEKISSLVDDKGNFYPLSGLVARFMEISINELKSELEAQVNILEDNDIIVDHLSDHCGVISLYTPFFEILSEIASDKNIPLRSPMMGSFNPGRRFSNSKLKAKGIKLIGSLALKAPLKAIGLTAYCNAREMQRKLALLEEKQVRHPDLFIESFYGNPEYDNLKEILENLPDGSSEIVVHLGNEKRTGNYPGGLDTGYFPWREKELETITSLKAQNLIKELGIQLIGFSDLN